MISQIKYIRILNFISQLVILRKDIENVCTMSVTTSDEIYIRLTFDCGGVLLSSPSLLHFHDSKMCYRSIDSGRVYQKSIVITVVVETSDAVLDVFDYKNSELDHSHYKIISNKSLVSNKSLERSLLLRLYNFISCISIKCYNRVLQLLTAAICLLSVTSVRGIFIIIQMSAGFGQIFRCPPRCELY